MSSNILDKLVTWVSPESGLRRQAARAISDKRVNRAGGYRSGKQGRTMKGWSAGSSDADSATLADLQLLRDRSRDLIRDNPLALGVINTKVTSIVGTGLKLQSNVDHVTLGISEEAASEWQTATEKEFKLWAESTSCDVTNRLNFYGIQELALRSVLESGDVFILLPEVEKEGDPYSLRLQLVEADRVRNSDNISDSSTLSGGIERDSFGAPLAYHISKTHPYAGYFASDGNEWDVVQANTPSGRPNLIHLFRQLRPNQNRGVPDLAPVIDHLKQLERYTDAELNAAVVCGMFAVFLKTENDGGLLTETTDSDGKSLDIEVNAGEMSIVETLPNEVVDTTVNPSRPNTAFDGFVMSVLRQIGAGLEIPYEILIKHFSSSYSASRASLLEAWRYYMGRRKWLADNLCTVVYNQWLREAILNGRIKADGFFDDPAIRKAWAGAVWTGDASGQIDEMKEIRAAVARVKAGMSTVTEETLKINGGDFDTNAARLKVEMSRLSKIDRYDGDLVTPEPTENDNG
jgi:lambda family phage portal protein